MNRILANLLLSEFVTEIKKSGCGGFRTSWILNAINSAITIVEEVSDTLWLKTFI